MTRNDLQRRGAGPHPGRLPDPDAHRARREAAGLPRLRGDLAASRTPVPRRRAGVLRAAQRRRAPRRAPAAPRRPPTPTRRARATVARVRRGAADEVVFTKNATEALNLVAYAFSNSVAGQAKDRAASRSARRRDPRHRDGAPRQPRAVAGARAAAPARRCAGSPVTDDGRLDLVDARRAAHRAHQGLRVHPRLQRARHGQPGRASSPTAARAVGALVVLDACQSVPHLRARRRRPRRRLRRLLRPQDVRPDRRRRALGPPRAARRDAAVPHRRLDDRDRPHGGARPTPPPPQRFEAGVAHRRPGRRPRCRRRLPRRARHGPRRRPRARAHRAAARRPGPAPVGAGRRSRRRASTAAARWPSSSTACTPTTSARCSTTAASPSGSGTTARGRCTAASASPRRPGPPSRPTTPPAEVDAMLDALDRVPGDLRGGAADGPLPGAHPRALQAPAPRRPARAVRRRGAPRQPDLRRRGDPARARRGHRRRRRRRATSPTTRSGCSISMASAVGPGRGGHRPHRAPRRSTTHEAMRAMLTSKGAGPRRRGRHRRRRRVRRRRASTPRA